MSAQLRYVVLTGVLVSCLTLASAHPDRSLLNLFFSANSIVSLDSASEKCSSYLECASCTVGRICRPDGNGFTELARVDCSKTDKPYCNDGVCSKTESAECKPNDFTCPSVDGTYPDPSSCTRYHICVHGFRTTNECPTNNVYDHDLGNCKLRRLSTDCVNFNCRLDGQLVTYPKDNRIWGVCSNGRAYILGKCKDYEAFDVSRGKCERTCRRVENQPADTGDCQDYIRCAEIARGRYEAVLQRCACNAGFDETRKECVVGASCLGGDRCSGNSKQETTTVSGGDVQTTLNSAVNEPVGRFSVRNNEHGNLENGNSNGESKNAGSIASLIDDSRRNSDNNVASGDDKVDGNLANGSGNKESPGDVREDGGDGPIASSQIIDSSGNSNNGNVVSNGNDGVNGNLMNESDAENDGSGNVISRTRRSDEKNSIYSLIVDDSGDNSGGNSVRSGEDVDGNLVHGNRNDDTYETVNARSEKSILNFLRYLCAVLRGIFT